MSGEIDKRLHWTQRIALVQHNLHMAGLSRDFAFFKSLQAHGLIDGADHAAILAELLSEDDEATDSVILNMDKFNAVIACVYEDAFKNVYGSAKACVADRYSSRADRRAVVHAEMIHQKQMADEAIDKMLSLAVDMIQQQPASSHDAAANVLIRGTTFTADAMEVCLAHIDAVEHHMDDHLLLEEAWITVQSAVGSAMSAMKGVFNLMASTDKDNRKDHEAQDKKRMRSQSIDGYARLMLRRMSHALSGVAPSSASGSSGASRHGSWTSALSRNNSSSSLLFRQNSSLADAHADPSAKKASHSGIVDNTLSPIPSTPLSESLRNPFDTTLANENAFISNNNSTSAPSGSADPRRPSDTIAPTDTSESEPAQQSGTAAPAFSSSKDKGSTFNDADAAPLPPNRTTFPTPSPLANNIQLDGAGSHPPPSLPGRRRSANVMSGEAPSIERLLDELA